MRGFAYCALLLVGLDLILKSPATRVATALAAPTAWLQKWMDPTVPLVNDPVPASSSSASSSSAPTTLTPNSSDIFSFLDLGKQSASIFGGPVG